MFPSMDIFLMRVPSELVEGEEQNLLGGVAMPSSRRLGRGTCRKAAASVARVAASISRRRDPHFDFGARRRRRLGGPAKDPALAAPTPTLQASPSRALHSVQLHREGEAPRERRAGGGTCEANPESRATDPARRAVSRRGRASQKESWAGRGGACARSSF